MLERIAPHLASIGIHKNGTWAVQKIIDCVSTHEEITLVAQHLRPYTPPLLLDQFGNYVVQYVTFGSHFHSARLPCGLDVVFALDLLQMNLYLMLWLIVFGKSLKEGSVPGV